MTAAHPIEMRLIHRYREQARFHKGGAMEMANTRKHKGEPKLPFNFVVRALFLLLRGGLLLFLVTVALYRCFCRSPFGIKSKRIFLSADLLFR